MTTTFKGKVAIVTGGASGIGRGIAETFIAEGMRVVLADIETAALQATAAEIGADAVTTDVSDFNRVQALSRWVQDRYGRVDVVCNNAGVGSLGSFAETSLDDWRWFLNVNLWGVIHGIKAFLPLLEKNPDGGWIVNTASVGGLVPVPRLSPYCVTKFGVVALTETLALELASTQSKVHVAVLCPGTVRTNIKNSLRNRPADLGDVHVQDIDIEQDELGRAAHWIEPREIGARVVEGMRRGDLHIFTHAEMRGQLEARFEQIMTAYNQVS